MGNGNGNVEVEERVEVEAQGRVKSSWVIPLLILVLFVVFLYQISMNDWKFESLSENGDAGVSIATMITIGGLILTKRRKHQIWRLLSSIWLHDGVFHLILNILFLVLFGIPMERELGSLKVGIIFIVSGIGGGGLSVLFNPRRNRGGAHGFLLGLVWSKRSELWTNWTLYRNKRAAVLQCLCTLLIDVVFVLFPRASDTVYLGGGSAGFMLGCTVLIRSTLAVNITCRYSKKQFWMFVISSLLLSVKLLTEFVLASRGIQSPHCISIFRWTCS